MRNYLNSLKAQLNDGELVETLLLFASGLATMGWVIKPSIGDAIVKFIFVNCVDAIGNMYGLILGKIFFL